MDLGQSDVHIDAAPSAKRPPMAFTVPEKFECAADVDSASEKLEEAFKAGDISKEEYDKAKAKLGDEGKKFTATDEPAECTARGDGIVIEMKGSESQAPIWIQVARPGKFRGHAAGHFEMNAAVFTQIIANFSAQENQFIPVDFEHASEQHPTEGTIPYSGAPAQGWITKLELRADGNLWGLVSWGELARAYIKKGQYKFLSPAIVFGAKDRVTGKPCGARLSSVALTNNPFLDGMQPVAAKRIDTTVTTTLTAFKIVREALELPAYMDESPVLVSCALAIGDAQDMPARATKLRDALRLPLTTTDTEVFNAARIACGAINPPAVVSGSHTETPTTAKEGTEMENKEKDTEISSLTLKLSAAEGARIALANEHAVAMKAIVDERDALKVQLEAFEEREVKILDDTAISFWGEKKGLTEESRVHLTRYARNDREGFIALYPAPQPGTPAQPYHTQLLAAGAHNVPGSKIPAVDNVVDLKAIGKDVPSVESIADKLMADAKVSGTIMSREEAFSRAFTERNTLITAAAKKSLAGNGG
jgi:phage I-like protein